MFTAKIENSNGQVMLLTGNETAYQVISIIGLNPPTAQINTVTAVGIDGGLYNSARLNMRNIVITIKINGDAESNRLLLYRYFRTKERCRFFYSNGQRDVFIEGFVESVACDIFARDERAQISILCPQPFFKSAELIINDISSTIAGFVFPFSIEIGEPIAFSEFDATGAVNVVNDSDSAAGMVISISFDGAVNEIEIRDADTGASINLVYNFISGDRVEIDTNSGHRAVRLTRSGITTNLFAAVQMGSVFLQLSPGVNRFVYLADGGANNDRADVVISHRTIYRGV